jgi:lipoprotein-anchoring transpeptidase ErfK/SrfK
MSNRTATLALTAAALMIGIATPASAREVVRYNSEVQPGTIVVKTAERRLYFVLGGGEAIRYTVAVGRLGKQWQGKAQVNGELYRVFRRLLILEGWSHDQAHTPVFS